MSEIERLELAALKDGFTDAQAEATMVLGAKMQEKLQGKKTN